MAAATSSSNVPTSTSPAPWIKFSTSSWASISSPSSPTPNATPSSAKNPNRLEKWVELGCLVQVTALSVLGGFGKKAETAAHSLLAKGMVHVIASDAHDPVHRNPRLDLAAAAIAERYGDEIARILFIENPGKILRSQFVSSEPLPSPQGRKWWQLFK